MVNNNHFTIAGKPVGVNNSASFDNFNLFAYRSVDVNAIANDFRSKFRMPEFSKRRAYLSLYRPLQTAAHGLDADSERRR